MWSNQKQHGQGQQRTETLQWKDIKGQRHCSRRTAKDRDTAVEGQQRTETLQWKDSKGQRHCSGRTAKDRDTAVEDSKGQRHCSGRTAKDRDTAVEGQQRTETLQWKDTAWNE